MKFKHLLRGELAVVALISCSLVLFSCGDFVATVNPYHNDVVKVTDVNSLVTDADIAAGVVKSTGDVTPVMMSHRIHENHNVACKDCHHKNKNDDRIKQCAKCHKGTLGRDVMHTACMRCHLTRKEGPTMCQECHEPVQQKL
ncbi:MAG: cytochrome c3 family protein [Spirochaetes bacterium]|nr:cytochrome c3 family protein [Spirochaetota bacterium]